MKLGFATKPKPIEEPSEERAPPNWLDVTTVEDGVRIQIWLDGEPCSWLVFETSEQAWNAVRILEKHARERFGDPV